MQTDHKATRREYTHTSLSRADLDSDPVMQFAKWLHQANQLELVDATAMSLATVNADGQPSSRIVLLKHFDHKGFAWYTDYRSDKGHDLAHNPKAALLFYWREMDRQIRIHGEVSRLDPSHADDYFYQRPKGSQLSAAASIQSAPIDSRQALEEKVAKLEQNNPEKIPRPDEWGGYLLKPNYFEFWQGRESRLHDRFRYQLQNDEATQEKRNWLIERIQP